VSLLETKNRKNTTGQQNVSMKELENELGVYFTRMKGSTEEKKDNYYNMIDDELF
jgi:hypothetical protein